MAPSIGTSFVYAHREQDCACRSAEKATSEHTYEILVSKEVGLEMSPKNAFYSGSSIDRPASNVVYTDANTTCSCTRRQQAECQTTNLNSRQALSWKNSDALDQGLWTIQCRSRLQGKLAFREPSPDRNKRPLGTRLTLLSRNEHRREDDVCMNMCHMYMHGRAVYRLA